MGFGILKTETCREKELFASGDEVDFIIRVQAMNNTRKWTTLLYVSADVAETLGGKFLLGEFVYTAVFDSINNRNSEWGFFKI